MERADLEQWRPRDVARLLTLVEGQRRYFQEIIAVLPVGVLVVSSDLELVLANTAARKTLSLPEQGPLRVRLDAALPSWVMDRVAQAIKSGTAENNILADTGPQRLQIGIIPIAGWEGNGGPEALLTIQEAAGVAGIPTAAGGSVPVRKAPASAPLTVTEVAGDLPAVLWAVEPRTMRPIFVSPQAQRVLGFAANFWISNPSFWTDRVHPADRERVMRFYQRAAQSAGESACEFRSVRADGQIVWLREAVRVVSDTAGRVVYLAGITVDVSERRLLEGQLVQGERVEAMQKLAGRMAHDLNNMLMILEGNAEEVLSRLPADSEIRSDIEAIVAAAQRIAGLTGHLLGFSRRSPAAVEVVDLEALLNAVALKLGIQRKGAFSRSQVNANASQLEDLLTTLAGAVASEAGTVTIEASGVEIREELQLHAAPLAPGNYSAITIGGAGGRGEFAENAFERFLPEKGAVDDTAVKLAQAYLTIRQWGGDIAVAGDGEAGFRIFLQRAGEAAAPAGLAAEPSKPAERRGATVLVVEDEAGIRALVQKFLRRHGYEVLEASNGEQALEAVQEHRGAIDLLITDMIMPRMGGREMVERLHGQGREFKVLYISGYTDDADVYAAELPAGSAFLQKPFTLSALLEKVRGLLAL
jgi:two-component system cell cycle sensor histidine kinase/response regulator CckA